MTRITQLNRTLRPRRWGMALAMGGIVLALGGCSANAPADAAGGGGETTGETAATEAPSAEATAAETASTERTFDGGSMSWSGKELTVSLEANPSSGYNWESLVTGQGLALTSTKQEEAGTQNDTDAAVGTPMTETLVFTGSAGGNQTIMLTYKRANESTDEDKVVTIEVATADNGDIERAEAVSLTGAEAAAVATVGVEGTALSQGSGTDSAAVADAGSGTDADVPVGVTGDSSAQTQKIQEAAQTEENAAANGDAGTND